MLELIPISTLKSGIEFCLNNGKRLLDDASLLHKYKKFQSAIPLYVLAFEEISKGAFLEEKYFNNQNVSAQEWKDLSSAGSHIAKIVFDHEKRKETLENMSDIDFKKAQDWTKRNNLVFWELDRKWALQDTENSINLMKKLNDVKKKFLYVDYIDKWQITPKFSDKMFDWLCTLLSILSLELYYRTKYYMEMDEIGISKKIELDSQDVEKMNKLPNFLEFQKIHRMYLSSREWRQIRSISKKMIESI